MRLSLILAMALALPMLNGLQASPSCKNTSSTCSSMNEFTFGSCGHDHSLDLSKDADLFEGCESSTSTGERQLGSIGFDWSKSLVERDNTFVAERGLWGFFAGALKSLAVWAGIRLTKWVLGKINNRATQYSGLYYQDSGVREAAAHWQDLQGRTTGVTCQNPYGREPDHDTTTVGYQGTDDCPICKKSRDDLAGR